MYADKDRARIGRYACENGNERARKRFLSEFPSLTESTIRNFKKLYWTKLKEESKKAAPEVISTLSVQRRGRPPYMLELDDKLIRFLRAIRSKGGVVNIHVVRATAEALINSNPSLIQHFCTLDMSRSWVHSIYRRMGMSRRLGTTGRPPVPRGIYEECRLDYLRDIKHNVDLYSIPPELVMNADQTPSSYVSVGKLTMAKEGSKSVPIKGLTDKRNITLTFVITLSGQFLPMQVIYSGKTKASQPRCFTFPKGFCISQNPNHWSNEKETLRLIHEVINPYVISIRKKMNLPESQKALLVWDAFKGQMTEAVRAELELLSIKMVQVPANMTHFFQPLDLTVNGAAKQLTKKAFVTYYSDTVTKQLEAGKQVEDIEVDLRLSVIKPLHAQWLVDVYNYFSTDAGREIIFKGWKKAGIHGLLDGSTVLPPENPFEPIYLNDQQLCIV